MSLFLKISNKLSANTNEHLQKDDYCPDFSPVDQKSSQLARKSIEGLGLVFLNIITLGTINFDLLKEKSWLRKEYDIVFLNKPADQNNCNSIARKVVEGIGTSQTLSA